MIAEPWQRILRIMDEAYADYLSGLVTLGTRVVDDVKRKVTDRTGPDRPHRRGRPRSGRAKQG